MFKRSKELDNVVRVAASKPARTFTNLAVAGVAATLLLTNRAAPEARTRIEETTKTKERELDIQEMAEATWKIYLPAAVSASLTIFFILRASKLSTIRSEALLTAFIIEPFVNSPASSKEN